MSIKQDKRIQSLYASLKNIMSQNLNKDEQEQLLEWTHKLILDTSHERKKIELLSKMRIIKEKKDSLSKAEYLALKCEKKKHEPKKLSFKSFFRRYCLCKIWFPILFRNG